MIQTSNSERRKIEFCPGHLKYVRGHIGLLLQHKNPENARIPEFLSLSGIQKLPYFCLCPTETICVVSLTVLGIPQDFLFLKSMATWSNERSLTFRAAFLVRESSSLATKQGFLNHHTKASSLLSIQPFRFASHVSSLRINTELTL